MHACHGDAGSEMVIIPLGMRFVLSFGTFIIHGLIECTNEINLWILANKKTNNLRERERESLWFFLKKEEDSTAGIYC